MFDILSWMSHSTTFFLVPTFTEGSCKCCNFLRYCRNTSRYTRILYQNTSLFQDTFSTSTQSYPDDSLPHSRHLHSSTPQKAASASKPTTTGTHAAAVTDSTASQLTQNPGAPPLTKAGKPKGSHQPAPHKDEPGRFLRWRNLLSLRLEKKNPL